MHRVVLDANILISALIRPQGPPGRILERFLNGQEFVLIVSPAILDEVRASLRYPRVRRHVDATDDEIDAWVASLGVVADVVEGHVEVNVVTSDPDDDVYVAAALDGRAEFLVSGDRHLLELVEVQGVAIVKARAFLDILESEESH